MSSQEHSTRASHRLRGVSVWAGFLLLLVLALYLVSLGVDWANPMAGLALNVTCFAPLVWVAWALANRARRLSRALDRVDAEWLRLHHLQPEILTGRACEMRAARVAAIEQPGLLTVPPADGEQGTPARVVVEAWQRYVAGEDVGLSSLRDFANEHNLERVESFSRATHLALGLGFLGTLVGIVYQMVLTQRMGTAALLAPDFLSGAVFAVTTTLQGVLTAFYASWLRSRLLRRMDAQLAETLQLLATGLLPGLGNESTRLAIEVADILRSAADRMERRFVELGAGVATAVASALRGAPAAVLDAVKEAVRKDLGDAVTRSVGELQAGVSAAVADLRTTVHETGKVQEKAGASLEKATAAIAVQLDTALHTPGELTRGLQDARSKLTDMTTAFSQITAELQEAGAALRGSDNQLLDRAQKHEEAAERMAAGAESAGARLDGAAGRLEASVRHLAGVVTALIEAHVARVDEPGPDVPLPVGFLGRLWSTREQRHNGRKEA